MLFSRCDRRIDCAKLINNIFAINKPLYDANVAFNQRNLPVGVNIWLTVALGAGRILVFLTANALRKLQEHVFFNQLGAVGMRYILPL